MHTTVGFGARPISVIALAAVALTLAACSSSGTSGGSSGGASGGGGGSLPSKIKIGVPIDITGSPALGSIGVHQQQGAKVAIAEINKEHLIGPGVELDPVYVDMQATINTASQAVIQLIQQDKVKAIAGFTLSGEAVPLAQIAQQAKIPTVSGIPSVPGVSEVGNYIFRVLPDLNRLFKVSDPQFVKAIGAKTVAYIYNSDNPTTAASYKQRKVVMDGLGIKAVATQTLTAKDTDLRAQLTSIRDAKPDVVLVNINAGQQPAAYNQGQQLGLFPKTPAIGDYSIGGSNDLQQAGKSLECAFYDTPWDAASTNGRSAQFITDYKATYSNTPDAFAALGYESVMVVAQGFKDASSTDGAAVASALDKVTSFAGILGTYDFDATREPTYTGQLRQIVNGQPTPWTSASPACSR
jgi:branched-chain amino acid transport system substrate-binding protein